MTRAYLEDNLLYEVRYEDNDKETLSGKEIRYMEDQEDFYQYAHVEYMNLAKKQPTKELQEISDRYYSFLETTQANESWYSFLDTLIEEGVIEK